MRVLRFAIIVVSLFGVSACLQAAGSKWVEQAGHVLQVALPLTALTATFGQDDAQGRGQFALAFGSTMASTYALKYSIDKETPDGSSNNSFPSVHSSAAFSGASFLAKRYGWEVGVPAYLAASFVGYSVVQAETSDWLDVATGAGLAIVFNEFWVRSDRDVNVALLPTERGFQALFIARF